MNAAEKLFSSSLNLATLNESSIEEAKNRFLEFQAAGVIKNNCGFDDMDWFTTDEYSNVGLSFRFNRFAYGKYESIFEVNFEGFIMFVKTFMLSCFGRISLITMQTILSDLRRIINANIDSIYGASNEIKLICPNICSDFFSMLADPFEPNDGLERLMNAMDSYAGLNISTGRRNQRDLADFDSYFLFDEIIKDYWSSELPQAERLFYYPLYLWWMLTAVIPLRPREFLLTERNCLTQKGDGTYYLRLRRNQIKGSGRSLHYKISEDYRSDTYKIPNHLGDEIRRYLDMTAHYSATEINTLFVADPHYYNFGRSKHKASRFLTYSNMCTILRCFYREIICGRLGMTVIYEHVSRQLNDNEIGYIHLGDTRHIAMINLMKEGGTPVAAMLLAGHDNMTTSSHYYTKLERFIECKTYRYYRRLTAGDSNYRVSPGISYFSADAEYRPLADGGRCYSKTFIKGDIKDCLASIGKNGEIGYCPSCRFYRPKELSYFSSDDIYKRNIENDCKALRKAVTLVRQGKGNEEDLGEALLKLRSSSISYETYLFEKNKSNSES